MWAFLDHVLAKGGVVALLFTVAVLGASLAIRALWNNNQSLHRDMLDRQTKYLEALTAVHEQRNAEAHEINDRLIDTLRETDASNGKLRAAMEALATAMQRGSRS